MGILPLTYVAALILLPRAKRAVRSVAGSNILDFHSLRPIFAFKLGTPHFAGLTSKCCTSSSALGEATMAGRYQGCHVLRDVDGAERLKYSWIK